MSRVPLPDPYPRFELIESARVSMTYDGLDARPPPATVLGTLTLGTVILDAVAPAEGFRSLSWLLPGEAVYVRPVRGQVPRPLDVWEWEYSRARIDWIDWPGVYLTDGGIHLSLWPSGRKTKPPRGR